MAATDVRVMVLIPARYASTRFPGKPLIDLDGRTMIQHVYERAVAAVGPYAVAVATDDSRIAFAVEAFGGRACMTRSDHLTGTDRLAEAAEALDFDLIVNVQGDEPTLPPECIRQVIGPMVDDATLQMSTLRAPLDRVAATDPNIVKVVVDRRERALYFSRAPIPFVGDDGLPAPTYKHIGIYAYRRDFLLQYPDMQPTPLERSESLEQLRALEHGHAIAAPLTTWSPLSIDSPEDVPAVLEFLRQERDAPVGALRHDSG